MAQVLKSEMKVGLPVLVFRYDRNGEADEHVDTGIVVRVGDLNQPYAQVEIESTIDFPFRKKGSREAYGFYTHLFIHDTEGKCL